MSPVDRAIIVRKLDVIAANLKALGQIAVLTEAEYTGDFFKMKATERLLQELIEAAIDVNTHLIVQTGHAAPDDYYDSFVQVGELGLIPKDLSQKLAPSAGLRNRLVHEYDLLDQPLLLQAVRQATEMYPLCVKEVFKYLTGEH
jgi:uncharacterized protein YutE (UPF0331/DUF86 family)